MADILLDNQSVPSTPASGKTLIFVDSTAKRLVTLNDAGVISGRLSSNDATASQGAGFAADTYVTNSGVLIPSFGMKAGHQFRWVISVSKTAAGIAAAIVTVRIGTAQTTSDTSRLALTASGIQTATVTGGLIIVQVGVRSVSATGVIAGAFNTPGAGFGTGADGASSTFDNTALAGNYVGLSINGGTSAAWTITHCMADLLS